MVSPSIMSAYEYFQWSAIDLLLSSPLREKPTDDLLVTLLEVKSVSNQFGKERVLCEEPMVQADGTRPWTITNAWGIGFSFTGSISSINIIH